VRRGIRGTLRRARRGPERHRLAVTGDAIEAQARDHARLAERRAPMPRNLAVARTMLVPGNMKPVLFIAFLALVPALADHLSTLPPCAAPAVTIDAGATRGAASTPVALAPLMTCGVPS
jgi:hypothetical protein